jgi:hypothetical protein
MDLCGCRFLSGTVFGAGAEQRCADTLFWLSLYPDWSFSGQLLDNIAVFSKPHPPLLIIQAANIRLRALFELHRGILFRLQLAQSTHSLHAV